MLKSAIIHVLKGAVEKGGRALIRDFGEIENLQSSQQNIAGFVDKSKRRLTSILQQTLEQARPDYKIIWPSSPLSDIFKGHDNCLIINPLDGEAFFSRALPYFAITIAVKEGDEITTSVIYDPLKDDLYMAGKGQGSYLNNRRLRVSNSRFIGQSHVATNIIKGNEQSVKSFLAMQEITAIVHHWGVPSLNIAHVAAGKLDAYFTTRAQIHDMAAALLILREAGGIASQFDARKVTMQNNISLLVCPPSLQQDFLNGLK